MSGSTSALALLVVLRVAPAPAPEDAGGIELLVVSVYRPVDMEGRTQKTPREVYLRPVEPGVPDLEKLVGQKVTVFRAVPVPAVVSLPRAERAPAVAPQSRPVRRRTTAAQRRAAAAKNAAKSAPVPVDAAVAAPEPPVPDRVERPRPPPVPTTSMEVEVARLEVTAVRGEVVVAKVIDDALAGPASPVPGMVAPEGGGSGPADLPVVMAGDHARHVVPPPPPAPPPPLTTQEQKMLESRQKRLEREDHRRRHPRGKYQRKKMKWKL